MIAGWWLRKVTLVEHISMHVSKTKVIFKCSCVTPDFTPEDKVYCGLQCVLLGVGTVISNNCTWSFFVCSCLVFTLKTRISSILSWPKLLASHDPFLTTMTAHTSFTGRTAACSEEHSSCAAAQKSRGDLLPLCLRIWSLFITMDFGAEWPFPIATLIADQTSSQDTAPSDPLTWQAWIWGFFISLRHTDWKNLSLACISSLFGWIQHRI